MASGVALRESVKEMKRLKNEPLLMLAIIAIILFVGFFVVYPVIRVITFPSGQDYMQLFQKARWFTALKNSLFMTLISTVSCTAVAFLFAYVIARLDVPCKGLFRFVTLLPIVSPPFIVALSYILLFGVQGIVTKQLLGLHVDIYGRLGLWIVQTVTFFPYAYSVIYGVIRSISTNLEYAAYNMGAPRWRVFKDVFWPLCRPGVAGGALVAAINVLTDFGNPQMIGGDLALLPTEAYMQISGWYDMKTASVLAVALLVPAVVLFLVKNFWVGKRSYVTITGKEISLNPFPVPKWVKWGLFSLTMLISLFILLVYGTLFYGAFTKTWGYDWSLTMKNIQYVFLKGKQIWNSIRYYKVTNHHGQGAETIMRAEALFCQGRFTDAHIELERAYAQVKDNGQINMALCCDFLSRRLSLYTDVEQRYTFEERYAELLHYHDASWINLWSAASAYYHALRGETDKIPEIFSQHRLSDINMLAPGKPMMEMIENQVYLAQGAYAKVIGHSAQLLAVCEAMHYALVALHIRIQTAAAYAQLGKSEEACTWLRQALSDAAPDGLVMPFVENYDFLKPLLAQERKTDLIVKITALGEGAGARNAASAHPAAFDVLTLREFEIVELIAQRLSNREIAEKLYLSEGSVKQYVNQIYSKLHMEGDTRTKRKRLAELFGQKT